jgi:hypothetical protein
MSIFSPKMGAIVNIKEQRGGSARDFRVFLPDPPD